MLKLTKKADYGLIALKYLAEHPERLAVSAKDVADAYGIPAQLLAKILQRLTKTGLLKVSPWSFEYARRIGAVPSSR